MADKIFGIHTGKSMVICTEILGVQPGLSIVLKLFILGVQMPHFPYRFKGNNFQNNEI